MLGTSARMRAPAMLVPCSVCEQGAHGSARVPHCLNSFMALAMPRSIRRIINECTSLSVPLA